MTEPVSGTPELLAQSPFAIPREDTDALCALPSIQVLRSYLTKTDTGFCAFHASSCDAESRETWLLHRDLLHALIMPVVELLSRASALAEAALHTRKRADLESAFTGEARSAFLWLQCFVAEDEQWCRTRGCPACVTTATLSTESHLRLTIAAALLSTAPVASPGSSPVASATSSPATSPIAEEASSSLTLPPLPHILPALREAVSADPFWGPDYWTFLFARGSQLSGGIAALICECIDIESMVYSSPEKPVAKRSATTPSAQLFGSGEAPGQRGAKLRKSKMAKRQLRMKEEEMEMMRRFAMQCWARAAVPSKIRGEILGVGRGERRVRCLTG